MLHVHPCAASFKARRWVVPGLHQRWRARTWIVSIAVAGCVVLATGTASSSVTAPSVPPHSQLKSKVAALGKITLTVEDVEQQVARSKAYDLLNKQFEKLYPNVKIKRVTKGYSALITGEKLLLSSSHAPDVVQINYGYSDQGPLVKGKLIQSLDPYAKAWGWYKRQPASNLDPIRMTPAATKLGTSNLWGMAGTVDLIGIYYNKDLLSKIGASVPKTAADFATVLDKSKAAGQVPLMIADGDQNATLFLWYVAMAMVVPPANLQHFLLGQPGANFSLPQWVAAAKLIRHWAADGYLPNGYEGLDQGQTAKMFGSGQGLFRPSGTWENGEFVQDLGNKVGFIVPPPEGHAAATVAGPGQPWCIVTKSKNQLAGAAYIDFITSDAAAKVFANVQDLAATKIPAPSKLSPSAKDIYAGYAGLARSGTGLSWSIGTPKAYTYLNSGGQEMLRGKITAEDYIKKLGDLYAEDLKDQQS
jgi:raffinose/stachyose/melibiose transport system substrate-binding protein